MKPNFNKELKEIKEAREKDNSPQTKPVSSGDASRKELTPTLRDVGINSFQDKTADPRKGLTDEEIVKMDLWVADAIKLARESERQKILEIIDEELAKTKSMFGSLHTPIRDFTNKVKERLGK
ncbi:MAG TPA: hypothetical protein VGA29_02595 [Ignavibacteriaceae bacterium]